MRMDHRVDRFVGHKKKPTGVDSTKEKNGRGTDFADKSEKARMTSGENTGAQRPSGKTTRQGGSRRGLCRGGVVYSGSEKTEKIVRLRSACERQRGGRISVQNFRIGRRQYKRWEWESAKNTRIQKKGSADAKFSCLVPRRSRGVSLARVMARGAWVQRIWEERYLRKGEPIG